MREILKHLDEIEEERPEFFNFERETNFYVSARLFFGNPYFLITLLSGDSIELYENFFSSCNKTSSDEDLSELVEMIIHLILKRTIKSPDKELSEEAHKAFQKMNQTFFENPLLCNCLSKQYKCILSPNCKSELGEVSYECSCRVCFYCNARRNLGYSEQSGDSEEFRLK